MTRMSQVEQQHPIPERKISVPNTFWEWCIFGILQLGWLVHFAASIDILDGVLMFPAGLVFLHVHVAILLLGLVLLVCRKWFCLPFLGFSLFGIFLDWNGKMSMEQRPDDERVSIMTWNIQGLDTLTSDRNTCAIDFLKSWTASEDNATLLLQEVPKSAVKKLEENLNLKCTWNSYYNHSKIGLLVCANSSWRFRFENHRTMDTGSSYGFQQVELSQAKGKHTFNILNVHMPSLAMVARKQGIKTRRSVTETLRANPNPKTYLRLLKAQHRAHQSSIERIADLSQKLKDPTIIGGDFNMPPTGSVHDVLKDIGMQDAHTEAGSSWGFTTERFGFLFNRIDFLYGSSQLKWVGQTLVHNDFVCSDHSPVTAQLLLPVNQ